MTRAELLLEANTWSWRRELLLTRIRELNDAKMHAFTVDKIFYGATPSVREHIGGAIWCYERDELDYCEEHCEAAEAAIIRDSQRLVNALEPFRQAQCLSGCGHA